MGGVLLGKIYFFSLVSAFELQTHRILMNAVAVKQDCWSSKSSDYKSLCDGLKEWRYIRL